jgi:hypothetical protein
MKKRWENNNQKVIFNQNGYFKIKLRAMKTLPLFNQGIND